MSSGLLLVIIELPVVPGGSTLLLIWQRITLIQMAGDGMSGILEYSDLCGCTRHEKLGLSIGILLDFGWIRSARVGVEIK